MLDQKALPIGTEEPKEVTGVTADRSNSFKFRSTPRGAPGLTAADRRIAWSGARVAADNGARAAADRCIAWSGAAVRSKPGLARLGATAEMWNLSKPNCTPRGAPGLTAADKGARAAADRCIAWSGARAAADRGAR